MVTVQRLIHATPEQVWAQLADGWIFSGWVVGATHIRDVDDDWPAPGAQLHHQIGAWPLVLADATSVTAWEPGRRLELRARGRVLGEALIVLTLDPADGGTRLTMSEAPTRGLGKWLRTPIQDALLRARNRESLARLASIAEKRPVGPAAVSGS